MPLVSNAKLPAVLLNPLIALMSAKGAAAALLKNLTYPTMSFSVVLVPFNSKIPFLPDAVADIVIIVEPDAPALKFGLLVPIPTLPVEDILIIVDVAFLKWNPSPLVLSKIKPLVAPLPASYILV